MQKMKELSNIGTNEVKVIEDRQSRKFIIKKILNSDYENIIPNMHKSLDLENVKVVM